MRRASTAPLVAFALICAAPARASADPVLELRGDRAVERELRFAGPTELPAPPAGAPERPKRSRTPGRATRRALDRLLARGKIDAAEHAARTKVVKALLRARRAARGARRRELGAVTANADSMAARGRLTPSRLEPVFLTLERNREWWTTGPLLAGGRRVTFEGSGLIWQYYPGQGIQLQMLANFGRANALAKARRRARLRRLLAELVPLASHRAGVAWEYYFRFGGGSPPWTSGMSQGTAVQALGRAGTLLGDPSLTALAGRALPLFENPPPAGVRVETVDGAFYALYTFAPDLRVLNGHLQAVIGLFDFAELTGDPRAAALYAAGEAEAHAAVPRYDTGSWSLYDTAREADLGYHRLVMGFLRNLCERTGNQDYCEWGALWEEYTLIDPEVSALTARVRAGAPARLRFKLDKISRVAVKVTARGGKRVFATSAVVGRGKRSFRWRRPARPGRYVLRVRATDLAGNASAPDERPLRVLRRRGR